MRRCHNALELTKDFREGKIMICFLYSFEDVKFTPLRHRKNALSSLVPPIILVSMNIFEEAVSIFALKTFLYEAY